jgi:hypothetical protein
MTPLTHAVLKPAVPSSSLSPRCLRPHDAPEPMMPSNPRRPWAHNVVILPEPARVQYCLFFFVILGLQILILICYIATLLWYATLLLFYCIVLMCYIATLLWYATLLLICCIALICYIAFVLLHCIDMIHCHIALICYTLLHCFYSAIFWSIWMHTTLLNDKSGLSETSVATWTNIIVLLRFQLRRTWSRSDIRISSSLRQSRWSFLLLLCHHSTCEAFSDDRSNNITLYFSMVCVFD